MIYSKKDVLEVLEIAYGKRDSWSHKTQNGVVGVVAGSYTFTGSATFNCMSAYRTGADLVFLVSPRRSADVAASFSPDIITFAREKKYLDSDDVDFIVKAFQKCDSVLIGGGLSQNKETNKMVLKLITRLDKPMVLDADALWAIGKNHSVLSGKKFILTPHAHEFSALSGRVKKDTGDRKEKVIALAKKAGGVVLLKGKDDIVADPKNLFVNRTGSPYMTKGGFGDCLAGVCAQMLTKLSPFDAACAAAYLSGAAGEKIAKDESCVASDIFDSYSKVIDKIKKKKL